MPIKFNPFFKTPLSIQQNTSGFVTSASNVGNDGVGVFKQKTGSDLEFYNLVAGNGGALMSFETPDVNNNIVVTLSSAAIVGEGLPDNQGVVNDLEIDPIYTASSWYSTANNSSNWNTAYGWGNHASAGYLTASLAASTYVPLTRTLNGIALSANQTFAVVSTGSDFSISSTGSTHTFALPDASTTALSRGLVNATAQSFAGDKTFTGRTFISYVSSGNTAFTTAGSTITPTNTTGTIYGIDLTTTMNANAAGSNMSLVSIRQSPTFNLAGETGYAIYTANNNMTVNGVGTYTHVQNIYAGSIFGATANVTVGLLYGLRVAGYTLNSGAVVNVTSSSGGIYVGDQGGLTSSPMTAGIYIANQTGGTENYSIYAGTGKARFNDQIITANGSASAPTHSFINSLTTGMYRAGLDIIGFSTAGVEAMRINATQQVGVGATTLYAKLHVYETTSNTGILIANNGNAGSPLSFSAGYTNGTITSQIIPSLDATGHFGNLTFKVKNDSGLNSVLSVIANNTSQGANVGIGTATPQRTLDVNGAIRSSSIDANGANLSGLWPEQVNAPKRRETPKITVSAVAPSNPKTGDFWLDIS